MMDMIKQPTPATEPNDAPPGIVVYSGAEPPRRPLITAFIWGAPQPTLPTLPFGRWKVSAA